MRKVETYLFNIRRDMGLSDKQIIERQYKKIGLMKTGIVRTQSNFNKYEKRKAERKAINEEKQKVRLEVIRKIQEIGIPFREAVIEALENGLIPSNP